MTKQDTKSNTPAIDAFIKSLDATNKDKRNQELENLQKAFEARAVDLSNKALANGVEIEGKIENFKSLKTSYDHYFGNVGSQRAKLMRSTIAPKLVASKKWFNIDRVVSGNQKAMNKVLAFAVNAYEKSVKTEKVFYAYLLGIEKLAQSAPDGRVSDRVQKQLMSGEKTSNELSALFKKLDVARYVQISNGGMIAQQPQSRDIASMLGAVHKHEDNSVSIADQDFFDIARECMMNT